MGACRLCDRFRYQPIERKGSKMSKKEETPNDKVEPESIKQAMQEAKHTPQEFADRYSALCKEFGLQVVAIPQWKQSLDTGDFRLVIQMSIAQTPKENQNG